MRGIVSVVAAVWSVGLVSAATSAAQPAATPAAPPTTGQAVAKIRADAAAMHDFVTSSLAQSYLDEAKHLPEVGPVDILIDRPNRKYYTPAEAAALPEPDRAKLEKRPLDETFYYNTRYGTPLAYARPLDLLAAGGHPGAITTIKGKRILDFGYGNIGQLHLFADQFASAVGVDVDPLLVAFYGQHDPELFKDGVSFADLKKAQKTGELGDTGSIRLVNGRWPAEPDVVKKVGAGYDLFISKNTLKRGYVHPERDVPDKRMLVDLGVTDEQFLAKLFEILNPGGWAMIYNICPAPAPADKPYIPWADGRCPFDEAAIKSAGFEVLAFDHDDTEAARKMAHILGWDQGEGAMNLKDDLFAWYTILRRPDASADDKPGSTPK